MPTYEYECSLCGWKFESIQSMKDNPLTDCPNCKQPGLRRLISKNVFITFKGPGFYVNDYGSGKNKAEEILND